MPRARRETMRALAWAAALLFALAAALQWNDPDPWLWIGLYGWATGVSVARAFARPAFAASLAGALAFLAISLAWLGALPHTSLDAFGSVGMRSLKEEEVRELWGALLGLAWCAMLAATAWRGRADGGG